MRNSSESKIYTSLRQTKYIVFLILITHRIIDNGDIIDLGHDPDKTKCLVHLAILI